MNAVSVRMMAGIGAIVCVSSLWAAPPQVALRVQINSDIRSTEPGVNRDDNSDMVVLHIVEGLVGLREDTSVGPMLAEKVDVADDGKTYTFTLRDNVKFSNGAPLHADDVVWTWKRYLSPELGWRCLPEFDGRGAAKVLDVKATGDRSVVFTLERPSALFLFNMTRADCGASGILHRSSLGDDGKWKTPVGTGPFKLEDWKRGQEIDLVANPEYVSLPGKRDGMVGGKTAGVERLRFMVIPDAAAAKTALYSGAVDVFSSGNSTDLTELKGRRDVGYEASPSMSVVGMLFQTTDPLLKDVRMRRALALALDYDGIAGGVTEGAAEANNSIVPATSPYYTAAQKKGYARDLAQVKKLLTDVGYRGQPIKMIANKRYEVTFNSAVLIQAMAAEAGINLQLEVLDWPTQLDRYSKGQFQTMVFSYSSRLDPSLSFEMISGAKATQPRKVWDNPAMLAKLAESMTVSDKAKRQALFDELHAAMIQDVPMLVLFNGTDVAGLRKNVKGYQTWPADKPRFWNVGIN
ncbi:ABC transporter substrate-binding protein [Alcaligenaceae bacterium B3P038]|nr:ABC transporter substrate-binding protein [Alcaligenaceae bacterium B3P038]